MKTLNILSKTVALAGALCAALAQAQLTVGCCTTDVSGDKAISVFKDAMNNGGGKWIDSPVAGGGGDAMNTVLRSRVLAGDPPGMAVLKGPNVTEWAEKGKLASLDDVAKADNWDKLLPPLLSDIVKYKGHYVAVPVDIHRVNWIWINPTLLAKVGGKAPTTWDEFNALADKLKAAGITPLAHGGQSWQDATVFETVVLGIGGPDFYRKTMVKQDTQALGSDTMKKVFDQMRKLRGYVDPNFAGRDWNLATSMVMNAKPRCRSWVTGLKGIPGRKQKARYGFYLRPDARRWRIHSQLQQLCVLRCRRQRQKRRSQAAGEPDAERTRGDCVHADQRLYPCATRRAPRRIRRVRNSLDGRPRSFDQGEYAGPQHGA